jgi:Xaa-Pro aminopeptidase
MNTERIKRLKKGMEKEKLDALVCRLPENVLFLSGYWPLIGWSFFVFPRDGKPALIVPHTEEEEAKEELWGAECFPFLFAVLAAGNPFQDIAALLKKAGAGKNWKRVGYEGSFEAVAPPWNAAEPAIPARVTGNMLKEVFGAGKLVDCSDFLNSQRACKTGWEAGKIRIANEISVFGLETFCRNAVPGTSGIELVAEVEHAIMTRGTGYKNSKRVRAFAQVSTGAAETCLAYRPMEISTRRKLKPGDIAVLELGVVADGYWCDRTRVRVAGKPTPTQREVFETIKSAQEAAVKTVRPGVTAGEVDEAARAIVRKAGYEKEFLHVTGHGLGFKYHEGIPLICPGSKQILEVGMMHSVEPGIYFPGMGGIRLEDVVLVTGKGREVLGPFKKELC